MDKAEKKESLEEMFTALDETVTKMETEELSLELLKYLKGQYPGVLKERYGVEEALAEGVEQKEEYLMSVYTTLFAALKRVLCPDNPAKPYTYQQLESQLMPYEGTSPEEYQAKLRRKFRRAYGNYNRLVEKEAENKKRIKEFEERSSL